MDGGLWEWEVDVGWVVDGRWEVAGWKNRWLDDSVKGWGEAHLLQ